MDSLTFLERLDKLPIQPLYVLHGDEGFLKRLVLSALRVKVLGPEESFALSTYNGDSATWATVMDELRTLPFLSPRRLVVVDNADSFVTAERARLEKFVSALDQAPSAGVLVLDVKSLPANTRLAKLVPEASNISCKTPAMKELPSWCAARCSASYGKQLLTQAARLLVDLVGPELGLLDQELAKLAVYVGSAPKIQPADVDQLVGQSRTENTFQIFDLIGAGNTAAALAMLNRLLDQGEDPVRLLGAFSWQLRRVAQVARLCVLKYPSGEAMEKVKINTYSRRTVELLLRHLGRRRLDQVYSWLLQADLGLKGSSMLSPRTILERLVVQLARPRS